MKLKYSVWREDSNFLSSKPEEETSLCRTQIKIVIAFDIKIFDNIVFENFYIKDS